MFTNEAINIIRKTKQNAKPIDIPKFSPRKAKTSPNLPDAVYIADAIKPNMLSMLLTCGSKSIFIISKQWFLLINIFIITFGLIF